MSLTRIGSDPETITADIPKITAGNAGVVKANGTVTTVTYGTKFLREDGEWDEPISYKTSLNGTGKGDTTNGIDLGSWYAATSTGTSGQVLTWPSSGNTPTWTNADLNDTKVQQSKSTTNNLFPLLASYTTDPNGASGTAIYDQYGPMINPSLHSMCEGTSSARGWYSHAEGWNTIAGGDASHTEGYGTTTNLLNSDLTTQATISSKSGLVYTFSGNRYKLEGTAYTLAVGNILQI